MKKFMLLDPQCEHDSIVLCFKNDINFNEINNDQFICDIPLKTALQIYKYNFAHEIFNIDNDVVEYLEEKGSINEEIR